MTLSHDLLNLSDLKRKRIGILRGMLSELGYTSIQLQQQPLGKILKLLLSYSLVTP